MSAPVPYSSLLEESSSVNPPGPDRRADVEGKQFLVAELLREIECDGLLVFEPANFAWLTSGANARTVLDPNERPALYFTQEGRYLLACNIDAQRFFDEDLDGLGFQLKEWPWHWGREQLIAYLCKGKTLATDTHGVEGKFVGERLRSERRGLTLYELAVYRELGLLVAHALEATCRTMATGQTEQEVAGQLAHRALHRGAEPISVAVSGDGRGRRYRRTVPSSASISRFAVLTLTARLFGLCTTASRTVSFGAPDAALAKEHDTACKVTANYFASSWPDAIPSELLTAGRRVYSVGGFEHDWRFATQGFLTGRAPIELLLTPTVNELFRPGLAVTWSSSVGAAISCDTYVVTAKGPVLITHPATNWPLKRIRIQGAYLSRPDIMQRDTK